MKEEYIKNHPLQAILFSLFTLVIVIDTIYTISYGLLLLSRKIFPTPLTNEEIITQTKQCESNGLDVGTVRSVLSMEIIKIQCQPK